VPKGFSQHNQGGWHHTEAAVEKCRQSALVRPPVSTETRIKISLAHKGKHYHSEEERQRMSERMSGSNNPMFGKPNTPEMKAKISAKLKGRFAGKNNPMANRAGALHPNWKGGISYLPYSSEFTKEYKESIRERDGHTCQLCGVPQAECIYPLSPHHIDYDKANCKEENLISLCQSCHSKTNYHREYWQGYLTRIMEVKLCQELKSAAPIAS
jgi:hypothetical protein